MSSEAELMTHPLKTPLHLPLSENSCMYLGHLESYRTKC